MTNNDSQQIQEIVEKRIPLFYGQPDIEISEVYFFLDAIKRLKKRINETTARNEERQAILLEELIERLRGRAYDTIREQTIKTVDELYQIIAKNFLPTYSIEQLSNRLHTAKQNHNETCTDFGKRVRSYASDYENGIKMKYGDDNTIPKPLLANMEQEAFMKGIKNLTIRSHLMMTINTSMNELMQTAARLETCFSTQRSWNPIETQNQVACQLCDKFGHIAKECNKQKEKEETIQDRGHIERKNTPPEIPTCLYCKRRGHVISECRTKRRAMEQQYIPQNSYNQHDVIRHPPTRQQETVITRYQRYERPEAPTNRTYNNQPPMNRTYNNQSPRYQQRPRFQNMDYPNYNSRYNKQEATTPPNQWNQNPNRTGQHNEIGDIDEGMRNLSINYIQESETGNNMDQGNDHGLVDTSQ